MKRLIIPTLWCAGLAIGLLPSAAMAQSNQSGRNDKIDAVFATPSADSVLSEIHSAAASENVAAGFDPLSPVSYVDGGSDPYCSCGEPPTTTGCGCGSCGSGCGESCWTRPYLTGDMGGARSSLAEHGILADLQMTQFYQGVSSGGSEQNFKYGGKNDYMFTFLGGKLGLNEGFTAIMHAETRFGEDITSNAGALAFPNTNMLFPFPGTHETTITGLIFMQALNERLALTAGKYNGLDLFNMLYPQTGRGIDGFMNLSLIAPIPIIRTTNISINGAGALVMQGKHIQGAVLVYDTNNSSTTVGLNDLFDKGSVVLGYWRFFTDIGGLPGSHGFLGNYSNRTYSSLDPTSWTVVPGQGVTPGQETGSWTIAYILDQVLWADCCNENRNLRLMSQWMIADGDPNFYRWSGNVTLQGTGLVPGREQDTMGIGYFFDGLSSDFKRLVNTLPTVNLQDVQGVELYYNAEITPWFHLTADLQVVDNSNVSNKTAIIPGIRANVKF